ncbi:EAL domain-containing response regulator [Methylobacter sp.]|uniref:EAL domain-containing response regulator n=1 Tax=Methylobacter sp. TaxID=2051955 RepID=UPI002FDD691D
MIEKSIIKILALDDETFMLKLLGRMLANLGFSQVTTCDSGFDALEWIDRPDNSPDIILLDLNMPEMDGVEFVRHLVERLYTGSLILISGEDERMLQIVEKLVLEHKISILGYLRKPVKPEDLFALLKKWGPPCQSEPRAEKKTYNADEVRAAIINGELINYYQPKVELASGKMVGVESLVRWRHPQDGIVFPDQFISVAEKYGLIDELTRTVVSEAFAQAKIWQDSGLHLHVALNISMDNLATLEFADYVIAMASATGIAPESIVLEVTESQLMKSLSAPLEILTRLCLKRFRLSIDDFGTGHSSLSQLRDIPFDELKVDQGFVHGAADNDTLRAICCASLSLAQQMGMKTVAEGVENQADWNFLRNTSCDLAQGYFIARPMPAEEIPGWISAWEANIENFMKASCVS